jgi:DNA-binding NarL/FixJ family response regulator
MSADETQSIRILLVEDHPMYARLIESMVDGIREIPLMIKTAPSLQDGLDTLSSGRFDVIILDLMLPDSEGRDTFERVQSHSPHIPIVILSSLEDDSEAIRLVKEGAQDYLYKADITPGILLRALRYAIERKDAERERERLISELSEALAQVRTLSGLLPICSNCRRIRNDKGYWERLEEFIQQHTDADFSHGICPECMEAIYPKFKKK